MPEVRLIAWNLGLGGVACKEVRWRHVHSAYVNTPVAISNLAGCARRQWQRAQPSSCAFPPSLDLLCMLLLFPLLLLPSLSLCLP